MRYFYLDESGDLGHDLNKTGTSRYFVITILDITSMAANKAVEKAVYRTLRSKIRGKGSVHHNRVEELKGAKTSFNIKKYFYRHLETVSFDVHAILIDKKYFVDQLSENKSRFYNFVTRFAVELLPLESATTKVYLTIDKSKHKPEVYDFNAYLLNHMTSRIRPNVPLVISHDYSHESKGLQAVDLFAWGIYRKYECGDTEWYDVFKERVVHEQVYQALK